MEILHSNSRRTIIAALDGSSDGDAYCEHLAAEFNVVRANSMAECLTIMDERPYEISAVIADIDLAQADDCAFLKNVADERKFDTIPVLIGSRREITDEDMRCLDEGAFDFILSPHHRKLTKKRIDNAVRMKRATTFIEIESILRRLPSNIFLKDVEGRYVFMTHYWHHLNMTDEPGWTVRGKTDLELRKDTENVEQAMRTDREIVATGKGTSYVIESNVEGVHDFMKLIKEPVFDENGKVTGIIALINDVTETELLKRELERRAHTDELTGLENRRAFYEYVDSIAGSAEYPAAIISADCDRLKLVNDTYGHLAGDDYIRKSAALIKACLPDTAHAYRLGGDEFIAVLPRTSQETADEIVAGMREQCACQKLACGTMSISFGTSAVTSADDSIDEAISLADRAMYEDKANRKTARASHAMQG